MKAAAERLPRRTSCRASGGRLSGRLQEGRIAGISTDSSILLGFKAQDPNTMIVGPASATCPTAMAINKAHPGLRAASSTGSSPSSSPTARGSSSSRIGSGSSHELESPPKPEYDG